MNNTPKTFDAFFDLLAPSRRVAETGYLIATGMILAALWARLMIAPTEAGYSFLTFFPAVTLAALFGGIGPGLFAMAMGAILAGFMFIPPFNSFPPALHPAAIWSNVVFYAAELMVIFIIEAIHRHRSSLAAMTHLLVQLKAAKQELKISTVAFETIECIMIADANGVILRVNHAFSDVTGYSAEDVVGKTPGMLKSGRHDAAFYAAMWESIRDTGSWQGEIWDLHKNSEVVPKWMTITAIKNEVGEVTHYVAIQNNLSERKAAEKTINHLAFYDQLTGLPNRRLLMDRLQHAFASSATSGREGAVLFIDLDNFKGINDTLGHETGNSLLQQTAQRLESCMGEGGTIARLGGDEFVAILEDLSAQPLEAAIQTEAACNRIFAALSQPYQLGMHEYRSTTSIGAILFSDHHQSGEELLQRAGIAMYHAKEAGRNTLRFFNPQMQDLINSRAALEGELRKALENKQLHLHYQIQVDDAYHPLGAEALIRWAHPERGQVSPAQFIPLAEETGLILPIGQWVLDTACIQLKAWDRDALTRDLVLSVNVSARQFHQADFAAQVQDTVQRHAIKPTLLKLELTESMLLENIEDTIATMNALHGIGVRFSLDDFGTGYSSLQYLKRLPLDQLKIDQSFVRDIVTDNSDKAIVRAIIALAQSLNLDVIAEGVETEEQRLLLLETGCTHHQGYLFGRPVPIQQFEPLLETIARSRPIERP